jgi:cytochrome c2
VLDRPRKSLYLGAVVAKRPTRSEEESYRLLFFIISQLIMLSMIWLIYQEFFSRRPWKNYQLGWFQVEKARAGRNLSAEQEWLATGTLTTKVDGEDVEVNVKERSAELKKKVAELEGAIIDTPRRVEFEQLKADLAQAEIRVKDEEMRLAFAKADEDEYYYRYRHAKHNGLVEHLAEEEQAYNEKHAQVLAANKKYDQSTAARDALLDKVGTIQAELAAAKKELTDLEVGLATAQRAVDATQDDRQWTSIEQFWNQEIDLVDRCHTCHVGFDRCGYTDPKEILADVLDNPKLGDDDLRKKYCITRTESAAYFKAAEKVRDSWYEDEKLDYEDVKDMLLTVGAPEVKEGEKLDQNERITEPVLATAHQLKMDEDEAEQLYRTHPAWWGLMRKHPAQTYGCTTCHYGQGRQTKGTGLNYLAAYLWEGDKHLAPFDHARGDHYWIQQILDNKKHHTEASCFNCHKNDYELEFAPHLTEGRKLVQHLGCTGCHPMGVLDPERKFGPQLKTIGAKVDTAYLVEWIKYPKGLRPRTKMPNFWPTAVKDGKIDTTADKCNPFDFEKNSPPTPAVWTNCAEMRDREAGYITAYLLDRTQPQVYPEMPATASAEKGKQLFENIGCRGCHNLGDWTQASTMPGSKDRDYAPNLTGIGDKIKSPGWFFSWVKNPKAYWHETRMPSLRLTDEEAWNIAAFLTSQTERKYDLSPITKAAMEEADAPAKGKKLIGYYGCFGCHEVEGYENEARIGADLTGFGSKTADKLDFGDVPELVNDHHAQTWGAWIDLKLQQPRIYTYERATTKMAQFDVTEDEKKAIILFLKSQNEMALRYPEHVKRHQTAEVKAIQRGEYLLDQYNCSGCHLIDNQGIDIDGDHQYDGGDIFRLYAGTDDQYRAPPKLIREGAKVYPDWLFKFLKAPYKLRENFVLRMPTFQLSDQDAQDLAAYFAAKAGKPYPFVEKKADVLSDADTEVAKKLFAEAQCANCHSLSGVPPSDPKNVAPNLRLAAERLQYDWLFDWLKDPQSQAPGVGMPQFFSPVDDKPGEYETPLTDIADGDWRRQIELLRAFVIGVGKQEAAAPKSQSADANEAPVKKKKRST